MKAWSGPGRALELHLQEWQDCKRSIQALRGWERQSQIKHKNVAVTPSQIPQRFQHWIGFARTYTRWMLDEDGNVVWDGVTSSAPEVLPPPDRPDSPTVGRTASTLINIEWAMLDQGTTYYASEEIVEMVTYAAELAEPEPIFPTDPPTPHGFCLLEQPYIGPDLHPDTGVVDDRIEMPIRAIGWTEQSVAPSRGYKKGEHPLDRSGIVLLLYTDKYSYQELYVPSVELVLGHRIDSQEVNKLLPCVECAPWAYGNPWVDAGPEVPWEPGVITSSMAFQRRWLFAFFRLMWQNIVVSRKEHPKRPMLRRLEHELFPGDGYVKVLHLRRVVTDKPIDEATGTGLPLRYRHRVRGHWKRVHVRGLGPARLDDGTMDPNTHRLKWIEDYVRGPEDGPFVDGYDVTAVVR